MLRKLISYIISQGISNKISIKWRKDALFYSLLNTFWNYFQIFIPIYSHRQFDIQDLITEIDVRCCSLSSVPFWLFFPWAYFSILKAIWAGMWYNIVFKQDQVSLVAPPPPHGSKYHPAIPKYPFNQVWQVW